MHKISITQFKQGDKASYRLIFEMLYPTMCLFARKFVQDYKDAEDIAQEMFIELWNQRSKFESIDQIKAFLYLSIKNRCLNFLKHISVVKNASNFMQPHADNTFEDLVIEAEVVQQLYNAIASLPEQQKQVILLGLQGLKNEEIAQNMQISINTVKLYKKIAYEYLRNKVSARFLLLL